jgi:hypothetical protein
MKPKILKTLWGVPYSKSLIKTLPKQFDGFEVAISFADFNREDFVKEIKDYDLSLVS